MHGHQHRRSRCRWPAQLVRLPPAREPTGGAGRGRLRRRQDRAENHLGHRHAIGRAIDRQAPHRPGRRQRAHGPQTSPATASHPRVVIDTKARPGARPRRSPAPAGHRAAAARHRTCCCCTGTGSRSRTGQARRSGTWHSTPNRSACGRKFLHGVRQRVRKTDRAVDHSLSCLAGMDRCGRVMYDCRAKPRLTRASLIFAAGNPERKQPAAPRPGRCARPAHPARKPSTGSPACHSNDSAIAPRLGPHRRQEPDRQHACAWTSGSPSLLLEPAR